MTLIQEINKCIEQKINEGFDKFIIYPFGDVGMQVKQILNYGYGIQESFLIDNHYCKYNPQIKNLSFLGSINCKNYCLFLASTNREVYRELKLCVKKYFPEDHIAELLSMRLIIAIEPVKYTTKIGKYSNGSLCRDDILVESIGAFCCFAPGAAVVPNHEMQYITTHTIIYAGMDRPVPVQYENIKGDAGYFEGVQPKEEKIKKLRRVKIGNDVWLGQNVLITNYSNIGNGVIAGAGAVITKDVPDYAVVAGVPARIIRYRYTPEQIAALNKIAWWDWSDEEIRERYDDLYLPIEEFIRKYI